MSKTRPIRLLLAGLLFVCNVAVATAEEGADIRIDNEFTVNRDLTYEEITTVDDEPVKPGKPAINTQRYYDFSPATQRLEVVQAWVVEPDGSRQIVPPEDIFIRSKPQPTSAPGFNADQRTTVVFPNVEPGARVHVQWKLVQKTPQLFGFNFLQTPPDTEKSADITVAIKVPPAVPLRWFADGGVSVTEGSANQDRLITATFRNIRGVRVNYPTVSSSEFRPRFMATTLASLSDYGDIIHAAQSNALDAGTAMKIKALADKITQGKKNLDAAAAIHAWIQQNISYVDVDLNPNDGWVEHPISKILQNGFGDCKDKSALMIALLAAKGIRAQRAVVNWGNRYTLMPLPLPQQFNHVLVYLQDYQQFDNPTDKNAAFGVLDQGLLNKQAVIIDQPSRVVELPQASSDMFTIDNHSMMVLSDDGGLRGRANITLSPALTASEQRLIDRVGDSDYLVQVLSANGQSGDGKITRIEPKAWSDPFVLSGEWRTPDYLDMAEGPDLYLPLQSGFDILPLSQLGAFIRSDVEVAPLAFRPIRATWTFDIDLPHGFSAKTLPPAVHISTDVGTLDSDVSQEGRRLVVKRRLVCRRLLYNPKDYPALEDLLRAAVKAGRAHAVLMRDTARNG